MPIMALRCLRPYIVPMRAGFGLDLSGYTGMHHPWGRITEWLLPPMLLSFQKKMLISFQKVLSKMLLETQCLRRGICPEHTTPHTLQRAKKLRGHFGPRETKGSIQDLIAASCQCRMGSIQTPRVCFSQ